MSSIRDQFAKVDLRDLQKEEANQNLPVANQVTRTEFHPTNPGDNIHRIAPPHLGCKLWRVPLVRFYLPFWEEVTENGQKKNVWKNKSIFHASTHAKPSTEGPVRDIIEAYAIYAREVATKRYSNPEDVKNFLKFIDGYRDNGKFVGGLKAAVEYVMYSWMRDPATKNWNLGRFSVKPSAKAQMDDLGPKIDDTDDVFVTDPFTDLDQGVPICLTYNKEAKTPSDYYKVNFWIDSKVAPYPTPKAIPDEWLEQLFKMDTLESIYVNVYKRKDFELAVKGLQNFDKKNNYGLFEEQGFLDMLEEIGSQFPIEADSEESNQEAAAPPPPPPATSKAASKPAPPRTAPAETSTNTPVVLDQDNDVIGSDMDDLPF